MAVTKKAVLSVLRPKLNERKAALRELAKATREELRKIERELRAISRPTGKQSVHALCKRLRALDGSCLIRDENGKVARARARRGAKRRKEAAIVEKATAPFTVPGHFGESVPRAATLGLDPIEQRSEGSAAAWAYLETHKPAKEHAARLQDLDNPELARELELRTWDAVRAARDHFDFVLDNPIEAESRAREYRQQELALGARRPPNTRHIGPATAQRGNQESKKRVAAKERARELANPTHVQEKPYRGLFSDNDARASDLLSSASDPGATFRPTDRAIPSLQWNAFRRSGEYTLKSGATLSLYESDGAVLETRDGLSRIVAENYADLTFGELARILAKRGNVSREKFLALPANPSAHKWGVYPHATGWDQPTETGHGYVVREIGKARPYSKMVPRKTFERKADAEHFASELAGGEAQREAAQDFS